MPLNELNCRNILDALQGMIDIIVDPALGQMLIEARGIEGSPSLQLSTFVEAFDNHLGHIDPSFVDGALSRINKLPHDGDDFRSAVLLDLELGEDYARQIPLQALGWYERPPALLIDLVRSSRKELSLELRIEPPDLGGGPRMGF